jgi:hypothetical protein
MKDFHQMKNKAKLFGIYLPLFLAVVIGAVVMRTVALFSHFDFTTGYFTEKLLISISNYTVAAAVLLFFTYIFTARRDISLIADFTSPATYIPTGIVGSALIFMTFHLFRYAGELLEYIEYLRDYNTPSSLSAIPSHRLLLIIIVATMIFSILSCIHFVLTALVESHSNTKRAGFGICTVIFLCLYAIYLYFSTELPLNAPNKTLDQMVYLFAAVFFLYETRLSLGRERWRPYIAFGFIAATVSAYSSVPAIIIYFANGRAVSDSVYEIALSFALFIFITSRLLLTGNLIEDRVSETVSALEKASDARTLEITPPPSVQEVVDISGEALEDVQADENQISIDDIQPQTDVWGIAEEDSLPYTDPSPIEEEIRPDTASEE